MTPFLAIVVDTWRQSKQQVVFYLMMAMLLVVAAITVLVPTRIEGQAGEPDQMGTVLSDEPSEIGLTSFWDGYAATKAAAEGSPLQIEGMSVVVPEAEKATVRAQDGLSDFERAIIGWARLMEYLATMSAIGLFLAACAGYFPSFLEAGAVDSVLAKPVSRAQVFFGKFLGGLGLFAATMIAFNAVVFVGLGVRFGVWHPRLFLAVPFQVFVAASLYAYMALFGMLARGTALPLVLGYAYYALIDTSLTMLIDLARDQLLWFEDMPGLVEHAKLARRIFPSFSTMNSSAGLVTLRVPYIDWEPYIASSAWMVMTLGVAYTIFRRRDF